MAYRFVPFCLYLLASGVYRLVAFGLVFRCPLGPYDSQYTKTAKSAIEAQIRIAKIKSQRRKVLEGPEPRETYWPGSMYPKGIYSGLKGVPINPKPQNSKPLNPKPLGICNIYIYIHTYIHTYIYIYIYM